MAGKNKAIRLALALIQRPPLEGKKDLEQTQEGDSVRLNQRILELSFVPEEVRIRAEENFVFEDLLLDVGQVEEQGPDADEESMGKVPFGQPDEAKVDVLGLGRGALTAADEGQEVKTTNPLGDFVVAELVVLFRSQFLR